MLAEWVVFAVELLGGLAVGVLIVLLHRRWEEMRDE